MLSACTANQAPPSTEIAAENATAGISAMTTNWSGGWERARVAFDFRAEHADELTVREGQSVQLLSRVNQDWVVATDGTSTGIVPCTYLQVLDAGSVDAVDVSHPLADGSAHYRRRTSVSSLSSLFSSIPAAIASVSVSSPASNNTTSNHPPTNGGDAWSVKSGSSTSTSAARNPYRLLTMESVSRKLRRPLFQPPPVPASSSTGESSITASFPRLSGLSRGFQKLSTKPRKASLDSSEEFLASRVMERGPPPKRPLPPPRLVKGSLPRPNPNLPRKSGFLQLRFLDSLHANEWKQYWCIFEKDEFRYFRSIMESVPIGIVPRSEIIQIHRNREPDSGRLLFEIQCRPPAKSGKRILFTADGSTDVEEWFKILSTEDPNRNTASPACDLSALTSSTSIISKHQLATSVEEIEKQGWLRKQGHSMARDWKLRFVVIKNGNIYYYKTMEHYHRSNQINVIDTVTCSVKQDPSNKNRFILVTPKRTFHFQAESDLEAEKWIAVIQTNIGWSIGQVVPRGGATDGNSSPVFSSSDRPPAAANGSSSNTTRTIITGAKSLEIARRDRKENWFCADCNAPDPQWASINLGVVICIVCSGVHRSLGVHISRVRSLGLDEWESETLNLLRVIGNARANEVWEACLSPDDKPLPEDSRETKEVFVRAKYGQKMFLAPKPFANCSILGGDVGENPFALSFLLLNVAQENSDQCLLQAIDLLARGADPNFGNDPLSDSFILSEKVGDYCTPLHWAVASQNIDMVELLIQNGADVQKVDTRGRRPCDVADQFGYTAIAALLRRYLTKLEKRSEKPDVIRPGTNTLSRSRSIATLNAFTQPENVVRKRLTGWLVKQGGKEDAKGWNKRWCMFEWDGVSDIGAATFQIFKSEQKQERCGLILVDDILDVTGITGATPVIHGIPGQWSHFFELHTWTRIYIFAAERQLEMLNWVEQIQAVLSLKAKKKSSRRSSCSSPTFEKRVFGVDLMKLAQRRQGSRDKGVPLFVSKVMGYLAQLWLEQVNRPNESLTSLYKNDIPGVYRGDIVNLTKDLKAKFDSDDEGVDLASEYLHWKEFLIQTSSTNISDSSKSLSFIRALIILTLNYLTSIPSPVIPGTVFDDLSDAIGAIRTLATANTWTEQPSPDVEQIEAIPTLVIQQKVTPILQLLPESNFNTLKKICQCLSRLYRSTDPTSLMVRRELAFTWSAPLCGHNKVEAAEEVFVRDQNRQFLFEVIIQHYATVFTPAKIPLRGSTETVPDTTPEHAVNGEISVTVHLDDGTVWSEKVDPHINTIQLTEILVQHLSTQIPAMKERYRKYALFEQVCGGMVRQLELGHEIAEVMRHWTDSSDRFLFQYSPFKTLLAEQRPVDVEKRRRSLDVGETLMEGWLYKEGVAVKSWKRRYFVLKPDYLYYYKDSQCLVQSFVGKMPYREFGVYLLTEECIRERIPSCPKPFAFCIRPLPREDGNEPSPPTRFLSADAEETLNQWIGAFRQVQQASMPTDLEKLAMTASTGPPPTLPKPVLFEVDPNAPVYNPGINARVARVVTPHSPAKRATMIEPTGWVGVAEIPPPIVADENVGEPPAPVLMSTTPPPFLPPSDIIVYPATTDKRQCHDRASPPREENNVSPKKPVVGDRIRKLQQELSNRN